MVAGAGVAVTVGIALTVTVAVAVELQPLVVPVTVYVEVVVPLKIGFAIVLLLKPADGVQLYEVAPAAVIVVVLPRHIVPTLGVAVTVGTAFTTTCIADELVTEPLEVQAPKPPVQVYLQ